MLATDRRCILGNEELSFLAKLTLPLSCFEDDSELQEYGREGKIQ